MSEPFFTTRINATGPSGNVFAVIAQARRYLRDLGVASDKIEDMDRRARAAGSYAEALAVVREWFPVDTGDEP